MVCFKWNTHANEGKEHFGKGTSNHSVFLTIRNTHNDQLEFWFSTTGVALPSESNQGNQAVTQVNDITSGFWESKKQSDWYLLGHMSPCILSHAFTSLSLTYPLSSCLLFPQRQRIQGKSTGNQKTLVLNSLISHTYKLCQFISTRFVLLSFKKGIILLPQRILLSGH